MAPRAASAFNKMYTRLIRAGIVPEIQRLDNEVSKIMIGATLEKELGCQLASPRVLNELVGP